MRENGTNHEYTELSFMNQNGGLYNCAVPPENQFNEYQVYFTVDYLGETYISNTIVATNPPA